MNTFREFLRVYGDELLSTDNHPRFITRGLEDNPNLDLFFDYTIEYNSPINEAQSSPYDSICVFKMYLNACLHGLPINCGIVTKVKPGIRNDYISIVRMCNEEYDGNLFDDTVIGSISIVHKNPSCDNMNLIKLVKYIESRALNPVLTQEEKNLLICVMKMKLI